MTKKTKVIKLKDALKTLTYFVADELPPAYRTNFGGWRDSLAHLKGRRRPLTFVASEIAFDSDGRSVIVTGFIHFKDTGKPGQYALQTSYVVRGEGSKTDVSLGPAVRLPGAVSVYVKVAAAILETADWLARIKAEGFPDGTVIDFGGGK